MRRPKRPETPGGTVSVSAALTGCDEALTEEIVRGVADRITGAEHERICALPDGATREDAVRFLAGQVAREHGYEVPHGA